MDLSLDLQPHCGLPLYKRLAAAVQTAIEDGRLSDGQPLPSVRVFATNFGVSPDTAVRCYQELAALGLIESVPKIGTFLRCGSIIATAGRPLACEFDRKASITTGGAISSVDEPELSRGALRLLSLPSSCSDVRSSVELDDVPFSTWQKLLAKRRLASLNPDAAVQALREAVCAYLTRARGILCYPEQILLTNGSRLDLVTRLLVDPGDSVAVEDPCSPLVVPLLSSHHAQVRSIASDRDGLVVAELHGLEPRFVFISPAYQHPTGASLSEERRSRLLSWACAQDTFIYENDVDHFFRYPQKSVQPLQVADRSQKVIYSTSFAPVLGPLAKVGFIVLPVSLLDAGRRLHQLLARESSPLEQSVLADFINDGHLDRHVFRLKKCYMRKRQGLVVDVINTFGDKVNVASIGAGNHILVRFKSCLPSGDIEAACAEHGLLARPTHDCYSQDAPAAEFLIRRRQANHTDGIH